MATNWLHRLLEIAVDRLGSHFRRLRALLYAFMLRQPIPTFSLPLLPGDRDPLVDLGAVLHDLYDRARYKLMIDYRRRR